MISLLKRIFIDNWPRKVISLILAFIVYFVINQSLTTTKAISQVSMRVINLPKDRTIEGIASNGKLSKKIELTLSGYAHILNKLSSRDFEVVIDATNKNGEWIPTISCKNLHATNPDVNIQKSIKSVEYKKFILRTEELVSEKIPVQITKPIGIPPRGYSYLDTWPYRLYMTVKGPKHVIDRLREKGIRHTFNLSDITRADLLAIESKSHDVVTYPVNSHWKEVYIPELSDEPITIDDTNAKYLRIDFQRTDAIPLSTPVPVDLFFLPRTADQLNPSKARLSTNDMVVVKNGTKILGKPISAKGVSKNFIEIVKDYLEIVVVATPVKEGESMPWSIQVANAKELENAYVELSLADSLNPELSSLHPQMREEYLRNRFRSYISRIEFYTENDKPLELFITRKGSQIIITDPNVKCESP
ncbi:MAG: hypothetical protein H7A40_01810 [Chlamydiales bacterium]|nr:hypothetical protein [Chlamydiales bacterium]